MSNNGRGRAGEHPYYSVEPANAPTGIEEVDRADAEARAALMAALEKGESPSRSVTYREAEARYQRLVNEHLKGRKPA